jgi:hypothetical protein
MRQDSSDEATSGFDGVLVGFFMPLAARPIFVNPGFSEAVSALPKRSTRLRKRAPGIP